MRDKLLGLKNLAEREGVNSTPVFSTTSEVVTGNSHSSLIPQH